MNVFVFSLLSIIYLCLVYWSDHIHFSAFHRIDKIFKTRRTCFAVPLMRVSVQNILYRNITPAVNYVYYLVDCIQNISQPCVDEYYTDIVLYYIIILPYLHRIRILMILINRIGFVIVIFSCTKRKSETRWLALLHYYNTICVWHRGDQSSKKLVDKDIATSDTFEETHREDYYYNWGIGLHNIVIRLGKKPPSNLKKKTITLS